MASDEENSPHELLQKAKKRRLHGACDICRRRKIKCTAPHLSAIRPGNICSNCEGSNIQCTREIAQQPKKTEIQQEYIRTLEEPLFKMEHVLRAVCPDRDVETLLDFPLLSEASVSDSMNPGASLKSFSGLKYPTPHLSSAHSSGEFSTEPVKQKTCFDCLEEEQDHSVELSEQLNKLFVEDKRFFGLSSTYMFAHYILHEKVEGGGNSSALPLDLELLQRPLYWQMSPWELPFARSQEHTFVYPEPYLLDSHVALYFDKSNIITPILHRPTFLRSLNSSLHLRDPGFGITVLLVCAIGSRFTSDSRVVMEDDITDLSAGWKYYKQVPTFRNRLFERSTLYDLQCYALSAVFLLGSSMVHVAWPLIGLGIRFAQEKGLHRRKGKQDHTVEDESAKRVFWALILMDRWMCAFLGRPCAMQDEDFDLEYPVECDDEYWETSDPDKGFQQPPGRPCKATCFIWMIKLVELLGFALRTLYATKKSKILIGLIGNQWEPQVVAELDSSMNKWKDSLPPFLHWNAENSDPIFLCQSIALHTSFYHLQIQIHKPFLMKRSVLSLTSLAMCTNAARSTAHVLEVAMSRGATFLPAASYMAAFASALVLLLTHWADQQSNSNYDSKPTMTLVRKLLVTLKSGEKKWHSAGRFSDLVEILGFLSDHRSNLQLKRRRELNVTGSSVSEKQQNHHGTLWKQASFTGGPLQRQNGATKLEPPALLDINNCFTRQMERSHVHESLVASQVDTPVTQQDPLLAGMNFQPSSSSQNAFTTPLFDPPYLQAHNAAEDPTSSMGQNLSDNFFAVWTDAPNSFSPYDWNIFLSNVMQSDM